MRKCVFVQIAAMAASLLCGCVAVSVSEEPVGSRTLISSEGKLVSAEIEGLEYVLHQDRLSKDYFNGASGNVSISFRVHGTFKHVTVDKCRLVKKVEYVSMGFFPGAMSCSDEYSGCVVNSTGAFYYNLVFAGLPTVYGLLVEPFVPYYPEQTPSMMSRRAFVQSAMMGVSKYSKNETRTETADPRVSHQNSMDIEGAVLKAPALGLVSQKGRPLVVPRSMIPANGIVEVVIELDESHPLKSAMAGLEGQLISVSCSMEGK